MRYSIIFLFAAVLAACAAGPVLQPRDATVPDGIDLTGQWQLDSESDAAEAEILKAERRASGADEDIVRIARKGESERSKTASLLHVFLEYGARLKITQTEYGVFVSFDRSIVEEYTFGEHRPINVGPVVAERVSGWEQHRFVIETADDKGNKLTEYYWLADGGGKLHRQITMWKKNAREFDIEQVYSRL